MHSSFVLVYFLTGRGQLHRLQIADERAFSDSFDRFISAPFKFEPLFTKSSLRVALVKESNITVLFCFLFFYSILFTSTATENFIIQ